MTKEELVSELNAKVDEANRYGVEVQELPLPAVVFAMANELFNSLSLEVLIAVHQELMDNIYSYNGVLNFELDKLYPHYLDVQMWDSCIRVFISNNHEITFDSDCTKEEIGKVASVITEFIETRDTTEIPVRQINNNNNIIVCNDSPGLKHYAEQLYLKLRFAYKYLIGKYKNNN